MLLILTPRGELGFGEMQEKAYSHVDDEGFGEASQQGIGGEVQCVEEKLTARRGTDVTCGKCESFILGQSPNYRVR